MPYLPVVESASPSSERGWWWRRLAEHFLRSSDAALDAVEDILRSKPTDSYSAARGVFLVWLKEIKSAEIAYGVSNFDGVPGRIRTCDAGIRRPALGGLQSCSSVLESLSTNWHLHRNHTT